MRISKEAKIGISSIIILFILYWGISFLKGANIFSSTNTYYAEYTNVQGLEMSSPVLINGMKVGTVTDVTMGKIGQNVKVVFTVEKKYDMPNNTVALLESASMMGGMHIVLLVGNSTTYLAEGDCMKSDIKGGMTDTIAEVTGVATNLIDSLTTVLSKVNTLLSEDMIADTQGTISNLNKTTDGVSKLVEGEKAKIAAITANLAELTETLNDMVPEMQGTLSNVNNMTDSLNNSLPAIMRELESIITSMNSKDGSIGKMLNDTEAYDNAAMTLEEAAALLKDLKENPKRYVHFSLFGRK